MALGCEGLNALHPQALLKLTGWDALTTMAAP